MKVVSFAIEPSIHNLQDAPSPRDDTVLATPFAVAKGSAPSIATTSKAQENINTTKKSPSDSLDRELSNIPEDVSKDDCSVEVRESESTGSTEESPHTNDDDLSHDEESVRPQNTLLSPSPRLLRYFFTERPDLHGLSAWIVRKAPCFCCSGSAATTDRAVLFRLNILCAFFALVQMGSASFLLIVFYDKNIADRSSLVDKKENYNTLAPNLWNVNGIIFLVGLTALVIFLVMMCSLRFIRNINLLGAIRYLWTLLWIIPIEVFLIVSLFDYHRVTNVWVKHWWYVETMAWFREKFCAAGTSRSYCVVPVCGLPEFGQDTALPDGGNVTCWQGEEDWCIAHYDSTSCSFVRNRAQDSMQTFAYLYYVLNGVWGILLIILLLLIVYRLQAIITRPVVQRSREANIPGWLTLPTIGCIVTGCVLLFSHTSVISAESTIRPFWIGSAYLVAAGLFFVALLLGRFISRFSILSVQHQRTKHVAVLLFIATMILASLMVAAIVAASIAYSINLVDFPLTDQQRGDIACFIDSVGSCSFCFDALPEIRQCPQWVSNDVVRVLRTQLKASAVLASIFLLYAFSATKFGFTLRKHLLQYQIDYV